MKNQAALDFLHRYRATIAWAINAMGVPPQYRDDVRQDVAYRMILRFRKHGPPEGDTLSAFAGKVTCRACIDLLRKRKIVAVRLVADMVPDKAMRPDELVDRIMRHEHLSIAIETLAPLRRHVVREVMAGKSLVELSEELGRTHTNMKVIHHRALNDLKKRLNP